MEACPYTIRKEKEQVVSLEEGQDGRAKSSGEEHDTQRAIANNVVMSKGAKAEGVYGPWMVVKRKFNGRKATKPSYGT